MRHSRPIRALFVLAIITTIIVLSTLLPWKSAFLAAHYLQQPCGIVFSDTYKPWRDDQKKAVVKACDIYAKTGRLPKVSFRPLFAFLDDGVGGAEADKDSILFHMHSVPDSEAFYQTALHELAHIIDLRNDMLSQKAGWLQTTGWNCADPSNSTTCVHECQQLESKSFYCDSRYTQTLPSRYDTESWDPTKTDVSVNPAEDFAESSRYFIEANDILNQTSPDRCEYFKNLYQHLKDDPRFDCDFSTN